MRGIHGVLLICLILVSIISGRGAAFGQPKNVDLSHYYLQYSEDLGVTLWVRDKRGKLGGFTAEFEVTDSSGTKCTATRRTGDNSDSTAVNYPGDFKPACSIRPGRYTWKCRVFGHVMAGGVFVYKSVGGGYGNRLTVDVPSEPIPVR